MSIEAELIEHMGTLTLQDGDLLVVRLKGNATHAILSNASRAVKELLGDRKVAVAVMDENYDMGVIRKEQEWEKVYAKKDTP